ncbi:MAG: zinc ribbon domain-containing protein, partial [Planctomycetota bacterium]
MKDLKELIVSCPNCSARYNVAKYDSGTKFKCKSCGKFLVVPEKPEDPDLEDDGPPLLEDEAPKKPSRGGRGGRSRGGRGRRGGGARARGGTRSRRRDEDNYDDDEERPLPRSNKGTNWPLILGAGGAVVVVLILIGVAISIVSKQEEENRKKREADARSKEYSDELPDEGFKAPPPKDKYKDVSKKNRKKPGESMGDGKIAELDDDKEAKGEETERTKWKEDKDPKSRAYRWKVQRGTIKLASGTASKGHQLLTKFKQVFGDPAEEREVLGQVEAMGKDALPLLLNFMTKDI